MFNLNLNYVILSDNIYIKQINKIYKDYSLKNGFSNWRTISY